MAIYIHVDHRNLEVYCSGNGETKSFNSLNDMISFFKKIHHTPNNPFNNYQIHHINPYNNKKELCCEGLHLCNIQKIIEFLESIQTPNPSFFLDI